MKTLFFVIGTRPEAIKLCPLILKIQKSGKFSVRTVFTGQHAELVKEVMNFFGIIGDYDFGIMKSGQSLSSIGESLLPAFEKLFLHERCEAVIVQGDTSSAFFAALSAFYHKKKVIHVEAGLRTHDIYSPFPEELNRRMIANIACMHFAPDKYAEKNLKNEGITSSVYVVGNTVTDAISYTLDDNYKNVYTQKKTVMVTLHRRENHGEIMKGILSGIRTCARMFSDFDFIFPVHPSPYILETAKELLSCEKNIILTSPMCMYDFHNLLYRCECVISDSGGVQEEASAMGIPIIVPRENTERTAQQKSGGLYLSGIDGKEISKIFKKIISGNKKKFVRPQTHVSEKIIRIIEREL